VYPPGFGNNTISYNRIYDVMTKMKDGGGESDELVRAVFSHMRALTLEVIVWACAGEVCGCECGLVCGCA
jgi:hypothetical protein